MKISQSDLARLAPSLATATKKHLLHVGCGRSPRSRLPLCFQTNDWHEIRLDIDPSVLPDIVASMTDITPVRNGSIDAIYSSHSLEHLEDHQVTVALKEFRRVLRAGGVAVITLPDIAQVAAMIASERSDEVIYHSPAGPITPIDVVFGHKKSIQDGNSFMAHRTGFTQERLGLKLTAVGFSDVRVARGQSFDLWAVARA